MPLLNLLNKPIIELIYTKQNYLNRIVDVSLCHLTDLCQYAIHVRDLATLPIIQNLKNIALWSEAAANTLQAVVMEFYFQFLTDTLNVLEH